VRGLNCAPIVGGELRVGDLIFISIKGLFLGLVFKSRFFNYTLIMNWLSFQKSLEKQVNNYRLLVENCGNLGVQ